MSPGSAAVSPPEITSRLASIARLLFSLTLIRFFSPFSPMRSLVPGYTSGRLLKQHSFLVVLDHLRDSL